MLGQGAAPAVCCTVLRSAHVGAGVLLHQLLSAGSGTANVTTRTVPLLSICLCREAACANALQCRGYGKFCSFGVWRGQMCMLSVRPAAGLVAFQSDQQQPNGSQRAPAAEPMRSEKVFVILKYGILCRTAACGCHEALLSSSDGALALLVVCWWI